jgi:hypothetical protein
VYTGFLGVADYNIMIQGGLLLSVSMFDLFNVSPMFVLTHSFMSSKKLRSGILGPLGGQTGHWMLDLVFKKRKLQWDSFL